jgi:CHAD domain-containing protein
MAHDAQLNVRASNSFSVITARPQVGRRTHSRQATWELDKLCKLARRQTDRFLTLVPEVLRDDDPMAIHRIRVASRRLEQILDLLYPKPRPKYVRTFRRAVKRCRRALGEIRNCDVLQGLADDAMSYKEAPDKKAWEAIKGYLRGRRARKAHKIFRAIGQLEFGPVYLRLKRDLDSPTACKSIFPEAAKVNPDGKAVSTAIRHRLLAALESHWNSFNAAVDVSKGHPQEETIHGVRIAAKKVRYLLEVVAEFDVPGSAEAVEWVRMLQRAIGEWHDLEVLEHMMTKALAKKKFLRGRLEVARRIEKLILENRRTKRASEARFCKLARESAEYQRTERWIASLVAGDPLTQREPALSFRPSAAS